MHTFSRVAAGATLIAAPDSTTSPLKIHGPGANLADSAHLELTATGELILAGGTGSPLAGFQVTIIGRFWVTAEGQRLPLRGTDGCQQPLGLVRRIQTEKVPPARPLATSCCTPTRNLRKDQSMKLTLDHTQRLNLRAILGAQRADVGSIRAIWAVQDRDAFDADEEKAVEVKREVVPSQEGVVWNADLSLPGREFEFTDIEVALIKAVIETWHSYGAAADRHWLEPRLDRFFLAETPSGVQRYGSALRPQTGPTFTVTSSPPMVSWS